MSRLTQSELRALAEAAAFRLCGDHDDGDFDGEALASAHQKVSERVRQWPNDDRAAPTGNPTEDDQ